MARSHFVSQTQEALLPRATCPMCGSQVSPARLLLDFDRNEVAFAGRKVKLRQKEMLMLGVLAKSYPQSVTAEKLVERVWPTRAPAQSTLRVNLMRMRRRLMRVHVSVTTVHGRYRLVLPDADTIGFMREEDTHQRRQAREAAREQLRLSQHRPTRTLDDAVSALTKEPQQ